MWRNRLPFGVAGLLVSCLVALAFVYTLFFDPTPVQQPQTARAHDLAPPYLETVKPLSPREVEIVFDEPVRLTREGRSGFSFTVGGLRVVDVDQTERGTVVLTLDRRQRKGRPYEVLVAAGTVADGGGNLNVESRYRFAGYGATGGVLSVSQADGKARPRFAVATRPSEVVVVDQIALEATGGDVEISRVRVRALASAPNIFADLVEAFIFEDDGDGIFEADGQDRQLHTAVGFEGTAPGAPATFSDLRYRILDGQTRTVWVVYRLGNLAVDGHTVGSLIKRGDIELTAGSLAPHADLVSANGGRTIVIDRNANRFAKGRVVDPVTVLVTFESPLRAGTAGAARRLSPRSFTVNGQPVARAEVSPDGTTVRLTTRKPLDSKTVKVGYSPTGGGAPTDAGTVASFPGPTYQSPNDTLPPDPPSGISASAGTSSPVVARITWNPSNDQGGGVVAGYRIWRATSAAGSYRAIGTTPAAPFYDTSGIPGQTYYYKVSAFDATSNESTLSAPSGGVVATWTPQPHATYGTGELCALCHASHNAATAKGILRSTQQGIGGTALCYECHDGSAAATNVKTGPVNSFALASGHTLESLVDTTNVDLTNTCSDCHGPHQDRVGRPSLWRSTINGRTVTGPNNTWCLACHDEKHSWYKPGQAAYESLIASPTRTATWYPTLGTFPGGDVATDPAKNAHASVAETPGAEPFSCRACHETHRGSAPQDMLRYQLRPSTAASVVSDRETGAYAQMCLRCHDGSFPGATDIERHVTADATDPAAFAGHRVLSPNAALPVGAPLPCYECHNVHGSRRNNKSNISDALGASLTTTDGATSAQVRAFCLSCHSTSDGKVWDSALNGYRSVRTTEVVVGLRRDGGPAGSGPEGDAHNWLKLKAVDGHASGDTDKSCYRCHGDRYDAGRNNVHNPGPGESAGALACAQCHDATYASMRTATSYHHYMASDAASAAVIADASSLTATDARRTCLVCHVDHDVFNPSLNPANARGRAANLRSSVASAPDAANPATYLDTDFDPVSRASVCTSCHKVSIAKNTSGRKSDTDRSAYAIKVTSAAFGSSAHNYIGLTATFTSDGSAFRPNCAKCHDDRTTSEFFAGRAIAAHDDTRAALITDFGLAETGASAKAEFCFACHSRAVDTSSTTPSNPFGGTSYTQTSGIEDVLGVRSMGATSVNVKGEFTAAGIVSAHPATASVGARVACANCHSVHAAGGENGIAADPDNTLVTPADGGPVAFFTRWWAETDAAQKRAKARTNRDFCLKCHDGVAPTASSNSAGVYVPYDVVVPLNQAVTVPNPTRRTDNKDDFVATSHYNTLGQQAPTAKAIDATCADCHDRHGSTLPALLGVPSRGSAEDFLGTRYIYTLSGTPAVVTGNDNSVCLACHSAAGSAWPAASAGAYPGDGRWPGSAVFSGTTGIHKGSAVVWPGREGEYAGGDCKNCHDPHGTPNPYDELRTETAAGADAYRYTAGDYSFCLNCHDGTPGADIRSKQPTSVGGTSAETTAGHTVHDTNPQGVPVGQPVPCWVCHTAHGSASTFGLLIGTGLSGSAAILGDAAGELNVPRGVDLRDPAYAAVVRQLCLSCHTTASESIQETDDHHYGWDGTAFSKVPTGTVGVLGLDRTAVNGGLRLKSLLVDEGHRFADTNNCLQCHLDIHSPAVPEPGKTNCFNCHNSAVFKQMDKDDPAAASSYHHVLGTGGAPDEPFGLGPYPGSAEGTPASRSDLWCLTCHVDHDLFDDRRGDAGAGAGTRAKNLRTSWDDTPTYTNRADTDFLGGGQTGICVSCHQVVLDRKMPQKTAAGVKTKTPVVSETTYAASAHQYKATSTFSRDGSTFQADCSKCHNSAGVPALSTRSFMVHASPERSLLASFSVVMTDPIGASHCLGCHSRVGDYGAASKPLPGKDFYGAETMTAKAEAVYAAFSATSKHPVQGTATGKVACENCHNPHLVSAAATQTDPANAYQVAPYGTRTERTAYCLRCHGATQPEQTVTASVYVPVSVRATAPWANKQVNEARSHWVANGSIRPTTVASCADCHDKHGSKYEKLVGVYDAVADVAYVRDTTGTLKPITGNDNTVCYGCHQAPGLGYPAGVATTATIAEWDSWRVAGGYISPSPTTTRTAVMWPGQEVYALSPHGLTARTAPASLGGGPSRECRTCHDVHGSSANPYDELKRPYTAGDYTLCFDCHDGVYAASNIKRFYPTSMGGQNDGDNAGHRVKTAGGLYAPGTPLPCWECHLTHGSADGNSALLSDARWHNLSPIRYNALDCRKFCLGCHTTEDRYVYSSAEDTMVPIAISDTENLVVGLPRSPVDPRGTKLILPHLQTGTAHLHTSTESCYDCHGDSYDDYGSPNVHNPSSGVSGGGSACYNCHTAYLQMEDSIDGGRGMTGSAAGNTSVYHHVLGSASDDGDKAPKDGAYPTSTQDVYCTSCHTDHNYFNASKNANLRASINNASGAATASSDFLPTGDGGICISCHTTSLLKDTVAQKSDGTTATPRVSRATYEVSAHQYAVQSYYDTATKSFDANCSKCHDDSFDYEQDSPMPNRFGTHVSNERKLLGPLGDASGADPLGKRHCFRCHSLKADAVGGAKKPQDGRDWYGQQAMTALSQATFAAFGLTGSTHPVEPRGDGSFVDCANCHNVHVVSAATPTVDPDDTYVGMPWDISGKSAFCLRCHDADRGPSARVSDASFVPTSVVMAGSDLPLMDKAIYAARGHWEATGAISAAERKTCVVCHDKHGSQYEKLLGVYTGGAMSINGQPISGNDTSVCFACHTTASTYATSSPVRSALGYLEEGTWPGKATWERGYNATEHTGSPHATSAMRWPGTTQWASGDCKNCHDVHGTANPKDMLRTTNASGADAYRFTETTFSFCFNCHDADGPAQADIATFYPVAAGGGGAGGNPRAGHRSGAALPCYDCHNPHGTGDSSWSLMVVAQTGPSTTVVLGDDPGEIALRPTLSGAAYDAAQRKFCFTCHTTSDTSAGWNGSAYAVVPANTYFEGIDRSSRASGKLRLPDITGHRSTDTAACYVCHAAQPGLNVHNLGFGMAEHLATDASSFYSNIEPVSGCVGAGDGCHGVTNDLTEIHGVASTCSSGSKTGVVNCHSVDGVSTTEFSSVRPGRTDGGRTAPNLDCYDCHDGYYADTPDRIEPNDIYPDGHYSEPTHTAGAAHLTGVVSAPGGGTASATCDQCHNPGLAGSGRGLRTQHQGVRATVGNLDGALTCKDCHSYSAAVSQIVTQSAFSASGKLCTACHSSGVLGQVSDQLVFHGTTAPSVLGTSTSQAGCGDSGVGCHGTNNWDLHVIHRGDGVGADPTCGGATGCHDYTKQGWKPPRDCDAAGCHAGYAGNGHYSATAHTATSGMADDPDPMYANGNGNECSDCHSAELGLSGWPATAHKSAENVTTCAGCHNSTGATGIDAAYVIKTNRWVPASCDNCHMTNRGVFPTRHDGYASVHTGVPLEGNSCAFGTNCHGNTDNDLRRLHDGGASSSGADPGCTASGDLNGGGCHMIKDARPSKKSCGGNTNVGQCHLGYNDGDHGSAPLAPHTVSSANYPSTYSNCSRCHADGAGAERNWPTGNGEFGLQITDAQKLDGTKVLSSMHSDPARGGVGCPTCHGRTDGRLPSDPISSESTLTANCFSCHTDHYLSVEDTSPYQTQSTSSANLAKTVMLDLTQMKYMNITFDLRTSSNVYRAYYRVEVGPVGSPVFTDTGSTALMYESNPGRFTFRGIDVGSLNGLQQVRLYVWSEGGGQWAYNVRFAVNTSRNTMLYKHTGPTDAYTCGFGDCHSPNIIEEHADYKRPSYEGLTWPTAPTASDYSIKQSTTNQQFTLVKGMRVDLTDIDQMRAVVNLRQSDTSARLTEFELRIGTTVIARGSINAAANTTYVWDFRPGGSFPAGSTTQINGVTTTTPNYIDVAAFTGYQYVDLYIRVARTGQYATNTLYELYVPEHTYSYTPVDPCELCHNNTGRIDSKGNPTPTNPSDPRYKPPLGPLPSLNGMGVLCTDCHPNYQQFHPYFSHRATSASDGCLGFCHGQDPPADPNGTPLKDGGRDLTSQHIWGDNTGAGITTDPVTGARIMPGTMEGGCATHNGSACHSSGRPTTGECVDCHQQVNHHTESHNLVNAFEGWAGHTTWPVNPIDSMFIAATSTASGGFQIAGRWVSPCLVGCHSYYLDRLHGTTLRNPTQGRPYRAPAGSSVPKDANNEGVMSCLTCHANPDIQQVKAKVNDQGPIERGVLKCTDCHNNTIATAPHQGQPVRTVTEPSIITGANLYNEFSNAFSVSGHKAGPFTNAFQQTFYFDANGWYRTSGTGRTAFTFLAAGNNARLRASTQDGVPLKNGSTALSTTTQLHCADCHGDVVLNGPQGAATVMPMYTGPNGEYSVRYQTAAWPGNGTICQRCHTTESFTDHIGQNRSGHQKACVNCHIGIPHAWKRPKLLVKNTKTAEGTYGVGDPYPYQWQALVGGNGTGLVGWNRTAGTSASTVWSSSGNCSAVNGNGGCGQTHSTIGANLTP